MNKNTEKFGSMQQKQLLCVKLIILPLMHLRGLMILVFVEQWTEAPALNVHIQHFKCLNDLCVKIPNHF